MDAVRHEARLASDDVAARCLRNVVLELRQQPAFQRQRASPHPHLVGVDELGDQGGIRAQHARKPEREIFENAPSCGAGDGKGSCGRSLQNLAQASAAIAPIIA